MAGRKKGRRQTVEWAAWCGSAQNQAVSAAGTRSCRHRNGKVVAPVVGGGRWGRWVNGGPCSYGQARVGRGGVARVAGVVSIQ